MRPRSCSRFRYMYIRMVFILTPFHTICFHPNCLFYITNMHTHTHTIFYLQSVEFDNLVLLLIRQVHIIHRCAAAPVLGTMVHMYMILLSSTCTANLLMNFCLSESMLSLVVVVSFFKCACFNEITTIDE